MSLIDIYIVFVHIDYLQIYQNTVSSSKKKSTLFFELPSYKENLLSICSLFLVQPAYCLKAISYFVRSRLLTFPLNILRRTYLKALNNGPV